MRFVYAALLGFTIHSAPCHAAPPDPLFRADDALKVTITAPVSTLVRKRPVEEELDGTFSYRTADGAEEVFNIRLRARGNFRRQRSTCPFPPVRLNFKKGEVEKTLFAHQNKVKLVTHCRGSGRSYFAALHRELLAYEIMNILSVDSFRARLLEITWVDTDKNNKSQTQFGFIIEHKDRLGKRIDRTPLEIPSTTLQELDPAYTNLTSLYQLFIANTDFSPIAGPPNSTCCHNAILMGREGEGILPVPYDFDMSGFVDAPYATPNPRFKLRSVKERKYRGRCVNNPHVETTIALFNDRRDDIEALITNYPYLKESEIKETLAFVRLFYDMINNPERVRKKILTDCVG